MNQAIYDEAIKNGCNHKLAEMFATRTPPGSLGTDRALNEGCFTNDQFDTDPFNRFVGKKYRAIAKRAGVSTEGKFYRSTLARFPGDPRAWTDSVGNVKEVAAANNLAVEGIVNVREREVEVKDPGRYAVADSLVHEELAKECQANPDLAASPKQQADRFHEIKTVLSGAQD